MVPRARWAAAERRRRIYGLTGRRGAGAAAHAIATVAGGGEAERRAMCTRWATESRRRQVFKAAGGERAWALPRSLGASARLSSDSCRYTTVGP